MFHFYDHAVLHWGTSHFWELSLLVWVLILLALTFDFLNGMHDAANSIATVVSTRVLSPHWAVVWAAVFNFVAFLIFPLNVGATIQKDIVDQSLVNDPLQSKYLIAATLIASCLWNLLTWYLGLPTSSSHALIGGLAGAALALWASGEVPAASNDPLSFAGLHFGGIAWICLFIVLAPVIGAVLGSAMGIAVAWVFRYFGPSRVDNIFRRGQLLSAALFSLGHGGNDAQKTMGVILALLIATHKVAPTADVPLWVVLSAHTAIALGTLTGGWRVTHTLGSRITKLQPAGGVAAESAAAATLFFVSAHGIPVSTTHTITGSIVGIGSIQRLSAVRWGVAGRVVWAWILTIPGAAIVAAAAFGVVNLF
jgi:inorganic phosphate transporter, PiT family